MRLKWIWMRRQVGCFIKSKQNEMLLGACTDFLESEVETTVQTVQVITHHMYDGKKVYFFKTF